MANDVIAAVATPPGRGGIGIVRVSGPRLDFMVETLVGPRVEPRVATRADFRSANGSLIDQGVALFFRAPHSYTGEDVLELQGHGGPVVMQLLLERCLEVGARVAQPGEFTKRAFLNDKLDLAQAEGVADLIEASTAEAARCAVRSLQGEFSQAIQTLVHELIDVRMLVEATLDFPEEEIEALQRPGLRERLQALQARVAAILAAARRGSLLREGVEVVIAGKANVGKSSLLNALAGAERAIVSDVPGTTRDTIRESITVNGVPLHIVDTAGLRESRDPVESIGIARARQAVATADLLVWVADVTDPTSAFPDHGLVLPEATATLRVANKIDLLDRPRKSEFTGCVAVSAKTGVGMGGLRDAILEAIGGATAGEGMYMARQRHLAGLRRAHTHLEDAIRLPTGLELVAEELRSAQTALSSITGSVTADDLLGAIFSRFCIGK